MSRQIEREFDFIWHEENKQKNLILHFTVAYIEIR